MVTATFGTESVIRGGSECGGQVCRGGASEIALSWVCKMILYVFDPVCMIRLQINPSLFYS